jgi:hypothetical protein
LQAPSVGIGMSYLRGLTGPWWDFFGRLAVLLLDSI